MSISRTGSPGRPLPSPGPPGHDFAVAAVFRERCRDGLARVALDFKAVRAPALVAGVDGNLARVGPARLPAPRRLGQQQAVASHHAIDAFVVHPGQATGAALPVDQRAGAPVAVAGKLCNVFAHLCEQFLIMHRRAPGTPVNPRLRATAQIADMRARQCQ